MTREIQIGGRPEKFSATGALPIVYRDLTGRDFFEDFGTMTDGVSETTLAIAWAMHRSAAPDDTASEKEWLDRFDFMALTEALSDIVSILSETQTTTSVAKKKNDQ